MNRLLRYETNVPLTSGLGWQKYVIIPAALYFSPFLKSQLIDSVNVAMQTIIKLKWKIRSNFKVKARPWKRPIYFPLDLRWRKVSNYDIILLPSFSFSSPIQTHTRSDRVSVWNHVPNPGENCRLCQISCMALWSGCLADEQSGVGHVWNPVLITLDSGGLWLYACRISTAFVSRLLYGLIEHKPAQSTALHVQ